MIELNYVAQYLRDNDRERYFATLMLPDEVRDAAQALFAFSAEIASVRAHAREPAPGEIRLQWWRDALEGQEHGDVRQNPIAAALLDAIGQFGLPTAPLVGLIEARRFDLYDDPMPDVSAFEGYAGETVSTLYQLIAMMLNNGGIVETGDAAGHLGVGQAMIGHLRAFGFNASQERLFLPQSVFVANGVTEIEIFSGTPSAGLTAAYDQLCEIARTHLGQAQAGVLEVPKPLRPAFASISLLPATLTRCEANVKTPFNLPRDVPDWQKIAKLSWWRFRNG